MLKSLKIAISLPREDFERIEKIRKELDMPRSVLIDTAIRFWLKSMEERKMIEQYERGYRLKPESLDEIKAMEKLSAEAFEEEEWK